MTVPRAVFLSAFLTRLGFGAVSFLIPYVSGLGPAIVGLVLAVKPACEMIAGIPSGMVADKVGRKIPMVLGLVSSGVILVSFNQFRSPAQLVLVTALLGVAAAAVVSSSLAAVVDHTSPVSRGGAMGQMTAILSAGTFVGFVGSGFLLEAGGEVTAFLIPGFAGIVGGLTAVISRFADAKNSVNQQAARQESYHDLRTQLWLLSSLLLLLVLVSTATTFLPLYARQTRITAIITSVSFFFLAVIALVSYIISGRLSDKYGRRRLMLLGLILVLIAESSLVWGYATQQWVAVVSLLAIASVGLGAYSPSAVALLGDLAHRSARGRAMGTYDSLVSLSQIIGPASGGAAISVAGFPALAALGAAVTAVNIVLIILASKSE